MEWIKALKDYVPLFQTLIWTSLIVIGIALFRKELKTILEMIYERVRHGSSMKAGFFEIGEDLRELKYVKPDGEKTATTSETSNVETTDELNKYRYDIYTRNRDMFLAHVVSPSKKRGQKYDYFIYLIRHYSEDLSNIQRAEFFFGPHWRNEIYTVENDGGLIGVATSAKGSFLCICRVVFTDGYEVLLDRYIDFEMTKVLDESVEREIISPVKLQKPKQVRTKNSGSNRR